MVVPGGQEQPARARAAQQLALDKEWKVKLKPTVERVWLNGARIVARSGEWQKLVGQSGRLREIRRPGEKTGGKFLQFEINLTSRQATDLKLLETADRRLHGGETESYANLNRRSPFATALPQSPGSCQNKRSYASHAGVKARRPQSPGHLLRRVLTKLPTDR